MIEIRMCLSHREPSADVSDKEEGVVLEVAHHGIAAAKLRGPTISLVVVTDGAVADHGQDEGEDPLVVIEKEGRNVGVKMALVMKFYTAENCYKSSVSF